MEEIFEGVMGDVLRLLNHDDNDGSYDDMVPDDLVETFGLFFAIFNISLEAANETGK